MYTKGDEQIYVTFVNTQFHYIQAGNIPLAYILTKSLALRYIVIK